MTERQAHQLNQLATITGEEAVDPNNPTSGMDLFSTRRPKDWKAGLSSG
jgi:hypothetical protein